MAFSMKQVNENIRKNRKKYDAKPLFAYVNGLPNVSKDVKKIINAYLRGRLKLGSLKNFTVDTFKEMLIELLEECCGKSFFDITPNDTEANYGEILYQLKYAIDMKYTTHIYHSKEEISVDDLIFQPSMFKIKTNKELDNFFEGVIFE